MPTITIDGAELFYELSGPEFAPLLTFSNSIGATLEMWDAQIAALRGRYRCLRYDTRGHGRSGMSEASTSIDDLANDLHRLLEILGIARTHLIGLSLGGMTAQVFAARFPDRLESLVLIATAAFLPAREDWQRRADLVRRDGMSAVANAVMSRWFTPAFAGDERAARIREQFLSVAPEGYAACCGAIAEMDLRPLIGTLTVPTLIIAGAEDSATPVALADELRQLIPGAEMVIIPRAAHMIAVERTEAVNSYLGGFFDRYAGAARPHAQDFAAGLANRKSVLGAEYLERSMQGAGAFAMPWQDFITRYAWAEIWGDPTLPWKTRSLVTLGMMTALHREEEFKLHLRPALRNGVSLEELRALLKQGAIYAGVPAANAAFRWAREALGKEIDSELSLGPDLASMTPNSPGPETIGRSE